MPMYPWIYWPKFYMHFLFPACMPHVPPISSSMSSKHQHEVVWKHDYRCRAEIRTVVYIPASMKIRMWFIIC